MATICDLNLAKKKPKIDYPCHWEYKVIFLTEANIKEIANSTLKDKEYKISPSRKSKKGSYESYNITVFVTCDSEREAIFNALKANPSIKFVL